MSYKDIPARPTLYKGIRMRSRLEADFAAYLDGRPEPWAYEPECFSSDSGQWLPDFRVDGSPNPIYIELKPIGLLGEWQSDGDLYGHVNSLMRKMLIARDSEPKCHLWLIFWEYGGGEMIILANHHRDLVWIVSGAAPFVTVWPDPSVQEIIEPAEKPAH